MKRSKDTTRASMACEYPQRRDYCQSAPGVSYTSSKRQERGGERMVRLPFARQAILPISLDDEFDVDRALTE